jgi:hypothetical protein
MLQTEVKSKMSALKQRLQKEPAFPDGAPPKRAIMGACQIAIQAGYLCPEGAHRHGPKRVTRSLGQHGPASEAQSPHSLGALGPHERRRVPAIEAMLMLIFIMKLLSVLQSYPSKREGKDIFDLYPFASVL